MDARGLLKEVFGYADFRPGQEELIGALLADGDALGVMPTGGGKSLCFQIPALLLDGVTIVVSPLISLMKDQVGALTQAGVAAAYVNSSLTAAQLSRVYRNLRAGAYKLLYVAPERLLSEEFLSVVRACRIPLVAVDEAHCISQWGQDFRPSYLRIAEFLEQLPFRPPVAAFTATATPRVREDIAMLLKLREPLELCTGFDRPNLYFEVQRPRDRRAALLEFVRERPGRSGIVYCLTRADVEEVCAELQTKGYAATRYHAGLLDSERRANQEVFQSDQAAIMVATNAFGMGIDKSNVSYVVHVGIPRNMESYYQEAGRAGRDGSPAECLLLYSAKDVALQRFFIANSEADEQMDAEQLAQYRAAELDRLRQITFYAATRDCLRGFILQYFGESPLDFCGNCFNCANHFESVDCTVPAQKVLSCVKRMGERFGMGMLIDTLRGAKTARLLELGFDGLSTYGALRDMDAHAIRALTDALLQAGYLELTEARYPVLKLGPKARELLLGNEPFYTHMPKPEQQEASAKPGARRRLVEDALFERLRKLRAGLAAEQNAPAFLIFSDATLRDMCAKMPSTRAAFLGVNGVGQAKLARYGDAFLQEIKAYRSGE